MSFYFIHRVIFPNYLVTRSKKFILKITYVHKHGHLFHDRKSAMHTCMTTGPCYSYQKIHLDCAVIFYFIHRVKFPNYLVTRSNKFILKTTSILTGLVSSFGLGKYFSPTFRFSVCGEKILKKNYLLN